MNITILEKEALFLNKILESNEIFIANFDTIFGIYGKASKENFIKINNIKKREKNLVFLFLDLNELEKYFNLPLSFKKIIESLKQFNVSYKISKKYVKVAYLETLFSLNDYLVIRIFYPRKKWFIKLNSQKYFSFLFLKIKELLKNHGPLFTTSCNFSKKPPARSFFKAKKFAKKESIYFSSYFCTSFFSFKPSTIIDLQSFLIIRKGKCYKKILKIIKPFLLT